MGVEFGSHIASKTVRLGSIAFPVMVDCDNHSRQPMFSVHIGSFDYPLCPHTHLDTVSVKGWLCSVGGIGAGVRAYAHYDWPFCLSMTPVIRVRMS